MCDSFANDSFMNDPFDLEFGLVNDVSEITEQSDLQDDSSQPDDCETSQLNDCETNQLNNCDSSQLNDCDSHHLDDYKVSKPTNKNEIISYTTMEISEIIEPTDQVDFNDEEGVKNYEFRELFDLDTSTFNTNHFMDKFGLANNRLIDDIFPSGGDLTDGRIMTATNLKPLFENNEYIMVRFYTSYSFQSSDIEQMNKRHLLYELQDPNYYEIENLDIKKIYAIKFTKIKGNVLNFLSDIKYSRCKFVFTRGSYIDLDIDRSAYDWQVAEAYRISGSLNDNCLNLNLNFKINLFTAISYNLIEFANEDLLYSAEPVYKIAKYCL